MNNVISDIFALFLDYQIQKKNMILWKLKTIVSRNEIKFRSFVCFLFKTHIMIYILFILTSSIRRIILRSQTNHLISLQMDRNILLPPIIIRDIIVPIGLFGNALILLTTIRAKSLRNNCNILIATQALFDFVTGLTDLIVYYEVYSNHLAISYHLCFGLLLIPSIAVNMSVMGMLMIGVDRILAVKYLTRYRV